VTAFERVGSSSSVKTVGILATLQDIDGRIVAAYRKLRRISIKQRVQVVLAPRRGSYGWKDSWRAVRSKLILAK
jgi:hypothetical protein